MLKYFYRLVFLVILILSINLQLVIAKNYGTLTKDCSCVGIPIKEYKVKLRPSAKALLKAVEKAFKKEICVVEEKNWPIGQQGETCITEDGTPVIRINHLTDDRERTIVHELFHLKFRANGYVDLQYYFPDLQINDEILLSLDKTFLQTVEHYMFFPDIRKMGIDPTAHYKTAIKAGDYKNKDITNKRDMVYYYYNAKLLVNDNLIIRRLTSWYKSNGLSDELVMAEQLIALVKEVNPKTPEEEVLTYVKVLNAVGETAKFELSKYSDVMLGSFKSRRAVILIKQKDYLDK